LCCVFLEGLVVQESRLLEVNAGVLCGIIS
jgi:hypothetical protein